MTRAALGRTRQELVEGAAGEDDVVGDEHVVGVELVGREQVDGLGVAQALPRQLVAALGDHEHVLALREAGERGDGAPGRRRVAVEQAGDDVDPPVARAVGQGTTQSGGLHLLGRALGVGARGRAVHDATAGELRSPGRTLTGAAGALLAVGLAAAAAHLAAVLGGVRALAGRSQLGHDDLVDQRHVDLDVEDVGGQRDRPVSLAVESPGPRSRGSSRRSWWSVTGRLPSRQLPLAAVRTRTSPPLGPGTAPLMSSSPCSVSTAWTDEALGGRAHATHPPGHLHPPEDATRSGRTADGARLAVVPVRAVRGRHPVEPVALHDAGGALALARRGDVDALPGLEELGGELLAQRVLAWRRRSAARRACAAA